MSDSAEAFGQLVPLLPVGSVVYLKGGTLKVVVMSRGELIKPKEGDRLQSFFDYLGCLYPQGYDADNSYYFNHEDIETVVFEGYSDSEEERYLQVLAEWKQNNNGTYIVKRVE